jgi:hypothetical protein
MQTHTQTHKDRCKYVDLVLCKCRLHWYLNSNYSVCSTHISWAACCPLQSVMLPMEIFEMKKKTYFKPFPGKAELECLSICDNL